MYYLWKLDQRQSRMLQWKKTRVDQEKERDLQNYIQSLETKI